MTTQGNSDSERLERIEQLLIGVARDQAEMKVDIRALQNDMVVMKGQIADLQAEVAVMKGQIADLQADMVVVKGQIADLQADMVVVKGQIADLQADMVVVKGQIAGLQADMVVVKGQIAGLQADMATAKDEIAVMKGWQTELVVERRIREVFRRLCQGHLLRIYPGDELHHYVMALRNVGGMSGNEASRAESIDFLVEGTNSEGAAVMFAIEVSYTAGISDCDRAVDKAVLLTRLLGRQVKPAVVGQEFIEGFADAAATRELSYTGISNGYELVR